MSIKKEVPFNYINATDFHEKLLEWIGDFLYDELPEYDGYDVRDEQIYTAFQVADAICDGKVHLAEAGLGTGKTFAYLLSAIPYARFKKKPVVIACATTALQEQLAGEDGDIQKLSKLLKLDIDARMAKDPRQYICDVRVEENAGDFNEMSDEVNQWLKETTRGERAEIPNMPDALWRKIAWDESLACDSCESRGYCKLVKAREHYRGTQDLIIVDHATFFRDLWTRKERVLNGFSPILPSYSAVIFDEGHKIMLPAAMQAGEYVNREEIQQIVETIEEIQGVRDSFMAAAIAIDKATDTFFGVLNRCVIREGSSNRRSVHITDNLKKAALMCKRTMDQLLMEIQIERELYIESIPENLMQAYEGQMERAIRAFHLFLRNQSKEAMVWVDSNDGSFWVVPRNMNELLEKELFKGDIPVILTSATLSNHGDFEYLKGTLGIKKGSHSSIESPFELENQVVIKTLNHTQELKLDQKVKLLVNLIKENDGATLVLTKSAKEVSQLHDLLANENFPFDVMYENQSERGHLIRMFRENEKSVLIGSNFWEGIDIPGEALTQVIIFSLPFPVLDPLIEELRQEAINQGKNPDETVNYPEMGLKLKQGCGRLIRRQEDHGSIVILEQFKNTPWENIVEGVLPKDVPVEKIVLS